MKNNSVVQPSALALVPMLLFLSLFIGSGLYYQSIGTDFAFYQISAPVAILPAIVLGLLLAKGALNDRIETFIKGVGDNTIITMVLIYLLAGAFASVAKAVGGVDATVNFGLSVIPPSLVLPGLFVISAFVATSMGTSMGTIAAIAPIAMGLTEATDLPLLLTIGTVIGGAMFGDNLSIISDTTIAATRTQGCEMKDKFRLNLKIALPAAALTLIWLFVQGSG
ncbi:MAG: Na+/H+ antiporter NhaC family protein, partial [Oceanospirillum sp.]|nr:Na+/H+ antiporter NhaC family protein [Oceanospirillum sp.]